MIINQVTGLAVIGYISSTGMINLVAWLSSAVLPMGFNMETAAEEISLTATHFRGPWVEKWLSSIVRLFARTAFCVTLYGTTSTNIMMPCWLKFPPICKPFSTLHHSPVLSSLTKEQEIRCRESGCAWAQKRRWTFFLVVQIQKTLLLAHQVQ